MNCHLVTRSAYYSMRGACWNSSKPLNCPFGIPGDWLWVRETWGVFRKNEYRRFVLYPNSNGSQQFLSHDVEIDAIFQKHGKAHMPSIHMPRWASRIELEVTAVGVERLRDITPEDAIAEGKPVDDAIHDFSKSWDAIYAKQHLGWNDNPWVWVIEFKMI